jgi:hypothetical protein
MQKMQKKDKLGSGEYKLDNEDKENKKQFR